MSYPKIVLVTGGNRGIGFEMCRQLAAEGHQVLLGSRDVEKGRTAAAQIPGDVTAVPVDMNDPMSLMGAGMWIGEELGELHAVIHNAGVMSGAFGPSKMPITEVRQVLETNFFGIYTLNHILLPHLKNTGEGRIVHVSSEMGERENLRGNYAAYRLSKYMLNGYTLMLANELEPSGVKVNAMCPGWVKTDMGGPNAQREVTEGADTGVWLATTPDIPTGKYFMDRQEIPW